MKGKELDGWMDGWKEKWKNEEMERLKEDQEVYFCSSGNEGRKEGWRDGYKEWSKKGR